MSRGGHWGRLLIALSLTLAAAVLMMVGLARWIAAPYKGFPGREATVVVPRGASVPHISRLLQQAGVIRTPRIFEWYVRALRSSSSLKAGEYRFEGPVSLRDVAHKLLRGEVYLHRVTLPEGLCRTEIVAALVQHQAGAFQELDRATRDVRPISKLDPAATDLEGYLFPDTYFFSKATSPEELVRTMVGRFLKIWTPERQKRAAELNMTVREVVTLASLIEKETGRASERPLVSAVFHNRLRRSIPLGSDPTVIYGVKLVKSYDGVIHQSDLRLDSPYNTYLNYGLPPGPIASPGLASIDAALYPAEVEYLYFVSRNDGSHVFSVEYQDHMRAVRKYQR
jgi:UPF0755 protein